MNLSLRQYQTELVDQIRDAYRHGKRAPLVQLPTGGGKTIIFCDIVERTVRANHSAYILVHRAELLRQASDHLTELGIPHGCIAAGRCITGDAVQVASVQTLVRRLGQVPEPDLVIVDEAHHSNAGSWRRVFNTWSHARMLGVTATPIRLDGAGLGVESGGYYDALVQGPTMKSLIAQGYLSRPVLYAPPVGADLTDLHTVAGDFNAKETTARLDKPKITGCAVDHYSRLCGNSPAIAFCTSIEHAVHVSQQFNAAGIPSVDINGKLDDSTRKYRIQALGRGEIQVLTSCDLISEGTDIPIVTAAILLRPTQSLGLYLQQVGRVLRPFPGKANSIVLDHVGNWERHGMPDQNREWDLNPERRTPRKTMDEDEIPPLRSCPQCYMVMRATIIICPQCGAVKETKKRELKQVNGTLSEITDADADRIRLARSREQGTAKTLQDLLAVASHRGYAPGWAFSVFNARKAKEFKSRLEHA